MVLVSNNIPLKNLELTNIYGFLSVLNLYKQNPNILESLALEKIHFFKIVSDDTILDCFTIESALNKSNLYFNFIDNVKISSSSIPGSPSSTIFSQIPFLIIIKGLIAKRLFIRKVVKIFDSSTSVIELIKKGSKNGDNYISIDGELYKSLLLNDIAREGRKFIL